jgi:hypothetical protein
MLRGRVVRRLHLHEVAVGPNVRGVCALLEVLDAVRGEGGSRDVRLLPAQARLDGAGSRRIEVSVVEDAARGLWVVRDHAQGAWWRPGGDGYTVELAAAGAVDEETARRWASRRTSEPGRDEAMPLSEALRGLGEGTVLRELVLMASAPWCPECDEESLTVDEEGCCVSCGASVMYDDDGRPRTRWASARVQGET